MQPNDDRFALFLNGNCYGKGSYSYIEELLEDYIVTSNMYGQTSCEIRIVNTTKERMLSSKS